MPIIQIDEPTIAMTFTINSSPFSGREGTYVTSRNLRDRMDKELLTNVSIKVDEAGGPDHHPRHSDGANQLPRRTRRAARVGDAACRGGREVKP